MPSTIRKLIISAPFLLPAIMVFLVVVSWNAKFWEKLLILSLFGLVLLYPAFGLHSSSFAPRMIATFFHRCVVAIVIPFALLMVVYTWDTGKHLPHTIALVIYSAICYYSYVLHKNEDIPIVEIDEKKYDHFSREKVECWRNQVQKTNLGKLKFFRAPHKVGIGTYVGVFFGSLMITSLGIGGIYVALFLTQDDLVLMFILFLFGLGMTLWGLYSPFDLYASSRYCIAFFDNGVIEKTWQSFTCFYHSEITAIYYNKSEIPDVPGTKIELYLEGKDHTMYYRTHWSPMEWDVELDQHVDYYMKSKIQQTATD